MMNSESRKRTEAQNLTSGPVDTTSSTLRSIANSIEPMFPDAADQLRGMAKTDRTGGAEAKLAQVREELDALAEWSIKNCSSACNCDIEIREILKRAAG